MLGVMSGAYMEKSWTCVRSGNSRSPGPVMLSQIGTVSGGLMGPVGGPVLGPFKNRMEALQAETAQLFEALRKSLNALVF